MNSFSGRLIRVCATLILISALACGGGGGNASFVLTGPASSLVSIEVTPINPAAAVGTTRQFIATGIYSNNTTRNITASVTWTSSNTSVAAIGAGGRATTLAAGSTTITATWGPVSGSRVLTVSSATLASIQVAPANPSIALGTTTQLTAIGIYSDNTIQDITTTAAWSSSNATVATVDSNGLAASVAAGITTITAAVGSISGSVDFTVTSAALLSIEITPADQTMAAGTVKQFTATGIYSDNTKQDITASVSWSTSNAASATISSRGLVNAVSASSTTITAALGSVSGSTPLTVTSATLVSIQVAPPGASIALGTTTQFTAIGTYTDNTKQDLTASVTWSSSNTAVAAVSNAADSNGLAVSVAAGSATITATRGSVSGSTPFTVTSATLVSIQVAPTNPSIALGTVRQFTATGIYSDSTSQDLTASVAWSSSNSAVAAVSNVAGSNGLATSVAAGSATITATSGSVSDSTTLTVTSATLVSIQVAPANPSIALGTTKQFTATGIYSDSTSQDLTASVIWSSSNTAVATVGNAAGSNGLAVSAAAGSVAITATSGSVAGSATLTVTSATLMSILVTPANPSISLGTTRQFAATGIFSDSSSQDLTASVIWTSSNTAVATVSNAADSNGLATPVAAGSATITAASGSVSGSTTLTVTSTVATLVSIQITPANPTISLGATRQFAATGIYSDGTSQDITASVTWSSSNTAVATVSNAAGSNGLASSLAAGAATITATSGSISGSTTLTVSSATLVSIQVAPVNPTIALGMGKQFTAIGLYSDSTTQDLTASVIWTSSNTAVATISNVAGSNGLATAIQSGFSTITATSGTVSGITTLTVSSATLASIQVTPVNPSIALASTKQFTATGVYSDGSSQDLTASVIWSSSNAAVATVSNAAGSNGLAASVAAGSATITATSGSISGSTTLSVSSATLVSIQVAPTNPKTALGATTQFTATGIYSDGSGQDLTASVTWNSSNSAVATVSNAAGSNGLAAPVAAGSATVTATLGSISASTTLTVSSATLVSIQVAPTNPSIALGTARQLAAIGLYDDSTTQDLTASVTWSSSDTAVAAISNAAGSNGLAAPVAAGSATITATLGSISASTTLTVSSATLVSIQVAPTNPSIALGATRQFTATGIYSDGSSQDLTASVTWSSSDTAVTAISNAAGSNGLATPVAAGSAVITATLGSDSGSATLTVSSATLASIQVAPTNPSVALGATRQFTATGIYSNGSNQDLTASVTWSSSATAVAAISNVEGSNGLATPVAAGSAVITATLGSISGSTTLTVSSATLDSIQVTPTNPSIPLGATRQFTATGIYSNGSNQDLTASVTWSSSNTALATVSNAAGSNGLASSIAAGSAVITATLGSVSGGTTLMVSSATLVSIQITPTNPSIALGTFRQFNATGAYSDGTSQDLTAAVTWSSSNISVATVSNVAGSEGLATALLSGASTITATSGSISGSATLTVTNATLVSIQVAPTNPSTALGAAKQFTATGVYSNGSSQDLTASVTWSSSNTAIATISNVEGSNGLATPVAAGSATIAATQGSVSGSTTLTVINATLMSIQVTPTNPSVTLGTTKQFTATGIYSNGSSQDLTASVTWSSPSTTIATISNVAGSNGLATPVAAGSATITATVGSVSGSTTLTVSSATLVSIQVTPTNPSIALGTFRQFTATGAYSDGSTQDLTASVTWSSGNPAVATVSNAVGSNGLASTIQGGSAPITATMGSVSGSSILTVTSETLVSIQVTPTNPGVSLGATKQFTATGIYSNSTTQDLTATVTWSSSNSAIATVSNVAGSNGLATPVAAGSATITATSGLISSSTTLTVSSATLASIQITPTNPSIAIGASKQFTATGIYSNGSSQDLTASVTWSSATTTVATVSNAAGSTGLASSVAAGSAIITATSGTVTSSTTLTVTSAMLVSIQVTPTNPSVTLGTNKQFTAVGTYSDSSTQDLTASATWSSSSTTVATISNVAGSNGLATPVAAGSTTITATLGSVSGSTTLTVSSATLQSIQLSPSNPSIAPAASLQFTATGIYSDNSTQDLTASVTWSSSDTAISTVSNAAGSSGLAASVAAGTATITATLGSVSGSTLLTVSPATLVSIQVSPTNPSTTLGATRQFTATGIYSDSSSQDLTASVTWSSSTTTVATISNAPGTNGQATPVATGSAVITATLGSVSKSTTLTVTSATLISIQVAPTNPSTTLGATRQFTAIGFYSDSTTQDLTASVTWSSATTTVATVSNAAGSNGQATPVAAGSALITATLGSVFGSTTLTVSPATLASIQVTPTNPSIAPGASQQFTATGVYSDGSTQDITAFVTWSSNNAASATISNAAGSKGLADAFVSGFPVITATSGSISGSTSLTVTAATLVSIQVSPTNPSATLGATRQFTAMGIYSDGSSQDLTASVTWSSSTTTVATISNAAGSNGQATPVAAGSATITATLGSVSHSTTLTVTAATLISIQVAPTNPSATLGATRQFTAIGLYNNGSSQDLTASVTWSSSSTAIATVSNAAGSNGLATPVAAGTSTITATLGAVFGGTTLTVNPATLLSIQVTPTNPSVSVGVTQQFIATGAYDDGSTQDLTASVTWSSSTTTVVTVSNAAGSNGLATPVAAGSPTITATLGSVFGSTLLTVTPETLVSIQVTPTNPSISVGATKQFTATGIYSDSSTQDLTALVTWSSSTATVATVSNAAGSNGLASSVAVGSCSITAALGSVSGNTTLTITSATLVSIQVAPTNPSIALGATKQFTATGLYSNGSNQDLTASVTWSSSNAAIAAVSNVAGSNGLATSVAAGSAIITAASGTVTGSTTLTVSPATLTSIQVTPTNPSIALGGTIQFSATGLYSNGSNQDLTALVTWSSSTPAVATISNAAGSNGLATSVAAGSASITATMGSVSGGTTLTVTSATLASIQVTPTNTSVALGAAKQFTATGIYSDSSTQDITASVTWSSSSTAVATVSNVAGSNGLATSVSAGSTTITATQGSVSGFTNFTITSATLVSIQVTPNNPSTPLGTTKQFNATGIYSDSTSQDLTASVTWSSSNTAIATVSNAAGSNGLATSVAVGSATITATLGSVSGSTTLTVSLATLQSIQITPTNPSIALGMTKQFTATGLYTDNTSQNLTASVTWSSSTTTVAAVSNVAGSNGLATSVAAGSTTITATSGSVSGSTTLTVTSATLVSIQVAPTNPSVALGATMQFSATGLYSDSTIQDLTTAVTWASDNTTAATISNAAGSSGLASSVLSGFATITATLGSVSGSSYLSVMAATLQAIDITPSIPSIALGTSQQFTAIGTYSDNTTADLTVAGVWSSTSTTIATISNAPGSNGLASSLSTGPTTITAIRSGISGSTILTVSTATLQSIAVTPVNPSIPVGLSQQFYASGSFSDGSVQDITSLVTWISSDTAVATVSNAAGSNGMALPVAAGSATITAWLNGVPGSTTLTVVAETLTSIAITPVAPQIAIGTKQQFIATGTYSLGTVLDITASAVWTSSSTTIATISNVAPTKGLATSVAAGTTTISAVLSGVTSTTTLTVTNASLTSILVTSGSSTLLLGMNAQFTATGTYSDATTQDLTTQVTWRSSNKRIATVSNTAGSQGLVTPIATGGPVTISAAFAGTAITGQADVTVVATTATLLSIDVTPANPTVAKGLDQQFTATGHYDDGSALDLTKSTTLAWSSSNTTVASIRDNPSKFKGIATAKNVGTTTISAVQSAVTGTTVMTVN